MTRSGVLWLAAVLAFLALAAWTLSRPDGLGQPDSVQPESSSAEPQSGPSSGEMPDVSVTRRAPAAYKSTEVAEEREGEASMEPQAALPIDVRVVGRVQDSYRVPIANAELELVQLVYDRPYGPSINLRSSPDGTFQTVIPIKHWEPSWLGAALQMKAWSPGFQLAVSEENVKPDSPRVEFKMKLWSGGVVNGRVVNAQSEPVAGADVHLLLDGVQENLEETREDGTYTMNIESAGEYVLHARKEPTGVSDPLPVKLQTDRPNEVPDLLLAEGPGEIAGVLVDTFGEPVPDHRLTAMGESYLASKGLSIDDHEVPRHTSSTDTLDLEEQGLVFSQVTTETDGSFRFTGLAPGRFAITSSHASKKVWVARTGQRNLRLVREVYTLHVQVQDDKNPKRPMSGSVYLRRSDGTQSHTRLWNSEVQIPVRPRESYVVGFQTPAPTTLEVRNYERFSSGTPPQMGYVERPIWIDPGDPNPSIFLPVNSQASGTLEVRCQPPKGLAQSQLSGKIKYGHESALWRTIYTESSSVASVQLAAGQYIVDLNDRLNAPVIGWIRDFAVAPPSQLAFPSNWSTTIPVQHRHIVEVLPEGTTKVNVEMLEAGAALIILGSEEESVPSLTSSTLMYPQGHSRSDTTRGYFISWDEGRPVSGHLLRWSLGAGKYKWRASAEDYRGLELEFTITPRELTVVRGTWRR